MSSRGPPAGSPVDVAAVLEQAPFRGLTLRVTLLSIAILACDGFDIQAIAFAAPALVEAWHIERAALGPVLAAGLIGMAIGAVVLGRLADLHGRRPLLIASTALFAVGSLLCAQADDVRELLLWRLVTGVGLGAPLPVAAAMIAEFTPHRWRSLAVAAAVVGIPLGGMLGAALARELVPRFGWPSIFIAGGILPALLAVVIAALLPESPKYLAGRPDRSHHLAALLNRLVGAPRYHGEQRFFVAEEAGSQARVSALFAASHRATTVALWTAFFTNIFVVYVFFNWLPTVLGAAGLPVSAAISGSLAFNLGGVLGALLGAALINALGSRTVLAALGVASILAVWLIGAHPVFVSGVGGIDARGLFVLMAFAGGGINGMQIGLYVVGAHAYPTALRATGIGAAGAVARLGAILSTAAGSVMFAYGLSGSRFFHGLAAVLLATLVAAVAVPMHIPRRRASTTAPV